MAGAAPASASTRRRSSPSSLAHCQTVAAVFAADGDTVVITGRRPEPLHAAADQLGPGVRPVVCDGTDPAQVQAVRTQLPETVDVLVHCAGGNTDFDRPEPNDLESLAASWRANLDANLITAVLMTAAVRDRLVDGGTVVNIGSIAADKGAGAYGAAKAGVASWNIDIAAQLGPQGVTATSSPPPRLHRRHRVLPRQAHRRPPRRSDRRHQHQARRHPRRRRRHRALPRLPSRPTDHRAGHRGQRRERTTR